MMDRLTYRNERGCVGLTSVHFPAPSIPPEALARIWKIYGDERVKEAFERLAAYEDAAPLKIVREITKLYSADDWDEDIGPVIWWRFDETNMPCYMPHIGSPLNIGWKENGYDDRYTHFTKIYCPTNKQVADALREDTKDTQVALEDIN